MAMAVALQEIKRKALEKRLGNLIAQYEATSQQLDLSPDAADRIRLKAQADTLFDEMEKTDAELKRLELKEAGANQRHRDWEDLLPQIDYLRAIECVEKVLKGFGGGGGAALFLLKDGHAMGGRWCVRHIYELLK